MTPGVIRILGLYTRRSCGRLGHKAVSDVLWPSIGPTSWAWSYDRHCGHTAHEVVADTDGHNLALAAILPPLPRMAAICQLWTATFGGGVSTIS